MSSPLISFTVDPSAAAGKLRGKADVIVAALTERTKAINAALQAKIAGEVVQGEVLKSHTGKLRDSVRVIPTVATGAAITGGVRAGGGPAYYAKFLEDGTHGPYTIQPKDPKGTLAFRINGLLIFRKKVTHPGLRAFEFMSGTLEQSREKIVASFQDAVNEATQ